MIVMKSGFRFTELYSMPINLRNWILKMIVKYYNPE